MTLQVANRLFTSSKVIEKPSCTAVQRAFNPNDSRISIFGSSGYIGSHFGHFYHKNVIRVPRDDYEPKSQNILYLISTTHNRNIFDNPQLDIDTNLKILIQVLEKCKNKDVIFNFVSSSLVYGDSEQPVSEEAACYPKGFYGITKKCAEDLLISYCKTFHIAYRILRLSTVYGKSSIERLHQKNALHFVIKRLKENLPVKIYFNGDFIRDYLHLNDAIEAINIVIERGPLNSIFNIGSGIPYHFRNLVEQAKTITKSQSEIKSCPSPEFYEVAQIKNLCLDITKLNTLGFKPNVSIETGIRELCS